MNHEEMAGTPPDLTTGYLVIKFEVGLELANNPSWREGLVRGAVAQAVGYTGLHDTAVDASVYFVSPGVASEAPQEVGVESASPEDAGERDFFGAEHSLIGISQHLSVSVANLLHVPDDAEPWARHTSTRTQNALKRAGIDSTLTLYMIGRQGALKLDGIGGDSVSFIDGKLYTLDSIKEWKANPGPKDWVYLCRSADELPALVVGRKVVGCKFDARMTLGTLLSMTDRDLANELYYQERYGYDDRPEGNKLPVPQPEQRHFDRVTTLKEKALKVRVDFEAAQKEQIRLLFGDDL